jgi:HTH-type transcriptional regulator/antitoxin HigA
MDPPDPIEAIKFRMEQQGLICKDLEEMIGCTRSWGSRQRC